MKKMAKMMDRAAWNARKKMMALAAKAKEAIENEDGDTNFISIAIILVIVLIIAMIFIAFWNKLQPIVTQRINDFIAALTGAKDGGV